MTTINCRIAGVTFADPRNEKRRKLHGIVTEAGAVAPWDELSEGEGIAVVLKRNPENRYDRNAIEVHVPALGDDGMLGHLPRDVAARLAPRLDAGAHAVAEVAGVFVLEGHDNYGVAVRVIEVSR